MNHRLALALACLLLFVQGVVLIETRWVEDESWNTDESVTWMREGRLCMSSFDADLASVVDVRPPLMPIGMGTTFRLFGIGIAQARMFSLAAGIGTVIVVWFLALSLWSPLAASLSVIAAATDLFIVVASRTARPEIHCAFFCSFALLLFYKARGKESFPLALLCGLCLGITLNFHPNGVGFVAALGVLLLIEFRARVFLEKRSWALVAGIVASVAPFAIWICSAPVNLKAFREVYLGRLAVPLMEKLAGEGPRYADFLGFGNRKVPLIGAFPLRLHLAIILVAAFVLLYRKNRKLATALAVVVLVNLLWWANGVNKVSRYFAVIAPMFSGDRGHRAGAIVHPGQTRATSSRAAVFDAVLVHQPKIRLVHQRRGLLRMARVLAAHVAVGDPVQLPLGKRQELLQGRTVAFTPGDKESSHPVLGEMIQIKTLLCGRTPPARRSGE